MLNGFIMTNSPNFRRGRDRMVVGFITPYAISAYHHYALDTTLCDKVCQWLATDRWFSPGPLVSFTNKTVWYNSNICWKWR